MLEGGCTHCFDCHCSISLLRTSFSTLSLPSSRFHIYITLYYAVIYSSFVCWRSKGSDKKVAYAGENKVIMKLACCRSYILDLRRPKNGDSNRGTKKGVSANTRGTRYSAVGFIQYPTFDTGIDFNISRKDCAGSPWI